MAKYTIEMIRSAVKNSTSVMGVLRILGISESSSGMHYHVSQRIKRLGINTSHFTGARWNKGKRNLGRSWQEILTYKTKGIKEKSNILRRSLIASGRVEVCEKCGQGKMWNNQLLTLQIDHKDGDNRNNNIDNLWFLCPNCHTQTPTYGKIKSARVVQSAEASGLGPE